MRTILSAALAVFFVAGCPNKEQNSSIERMNTCVKAYSNKQYETAVTECKKSVEEWRENHQAWYTLGAAYAGRANWEDSAAAFEKAVSIRDGEAMYQMWYGVSSYEKAIQQAAEAQAKALGKKVTEIKVDLSTVSFDKAAQNLQAAIKRNKDLWRAHYYLGKIYRETNRDQDAATHFTEAIKAAPNESGPYVALGELYRKWDYPDQAIQVTTLGTQHVPGNQEVATVWYVLGMAYNDKRQDDKAIEAFTKALEAKRDYHRAKFQRGQSYYRKGELGKALKDLDEFAKGGSASDDFAKNQAQRMLAEIRSKQQ
jgi:tetratricopeptide (TPR) repeat protein